jgi:hypothetical protein
MGFLQIRLDQEQSLFRLTRPGKKTWPDGNGLGKFYGQAERAISMSQLRALLHFHLSPIKVVVFDRSS